MSPGRTRVRVARQARRDVNQILLTSVDSFGTDAQRRYRSLVRAALRALRQASRPAGCTARPELGFRIMTFHLRHGRARLPIAERTRSPPRHLFVLRHEADGSLTVLRLLHDAMDLARHLPDAPGPGGTPTDPPTG